jgi:catechol 2,3-dioxygenase-like lactoylglutathione lyase family enzyme
VFERFTERARQVIVLAQEETLKLRHDHIGTEHLLLGLAREQEGLAARVLRSLGVTVESVREQLQPGPAPDPDAEPGGRQIPFTPGAKSVLQLGLREAIGLGHNYIGTEHLLLGLIREDDGDGARILTRLGAEPEKIRGELMSMLSGRVFAASRRWQSGQRGRRSDVTSVVGLDHVQLAAPAGCEADARRFFCELLGLTEVAKPEALRQRGGVWFRVGSQQLHLGVQEGFAPARKAHPAILVEQDALDELAQRLQSAGAKVIWDDELDGARRFYTEDPWGNRIELLARA